ncbi:MAG: single-stranded DNA-binding protein [Flavobacteriaceae bacterium]|tara:strand:- start:173 stop:595 length:423 start_codon:yes stop_codon:yes gene_type:complete
MSGTLNKVMLIGHLGDEIKMHHFEGGGCIGRFPLATNETYTNKSTGEKVSSTEWHNIVVRNKAAELCQKYLSKGDKVYIEGKIKSRKWTDDSGKERYMNEINTDIFTFLNNKNDDKQLNSSGNEVNETFDSDTKEQDLPF